MLETGSLIGGYRIDELISRGGMGLVYRATSVALNRIYALKVLAPELAEDAQFRERFKREIRIAASLGHPHIVGIHYAGEHEGMLFFVMDFVTGTDLHHVVARSGPLDPHRAVDLLEQSASALDAAHGGGLVHRDVKPGNILITVRDGREHAYLTDFGLAKRSDAASALTAKGLMVGTVDYMAPEQVTGVNTDARTDIYALGCVFFQMLSGRVPYERENSVATLFAHVHEPAPVLDETITERFPDFAPVLEKAMAKDPADRYFSAGDFARDAAAALGGMRYTEPPTIVATGEATLRPTKPPAPAPADPSAGGQPPARGDPPAPPREPAVPAAGATGPPAAGGGGPTVPPGLPVGIPADEPESSGARAVPPFAAAAGAPTAPPAGPPGAPAEPTVPPAEPTAPPPLQPEVSGSETVITGGEPVAAAAATPGAPVAAAPAGPGGPAGPSSGGPPGPGGNGASGGRSRGRRALPIAAAIVVLGGAAAAVVAITSGGSGGGSASTGKTATTAAPPGTAFAANAQPVPTNRVTGNGDATIALDGRKATITVDTKGLLNGSPHLMHIHAGGKGLCPPASAAGPHNGHRSISTQAGVPFYGPPEVAVTSKGDTSQKSTLDFSRFPATGDIRYKRTITLPPGVVGAIKADNAVFIVHGIDYNRNGIYDFVLDRSELDHRIPGEATAPAICGRLRPDRAPSGASANAGTTSYTAVLDRRIATPAAPGAPLLCPLHVASAADQRVGAVGRL